MKTQLNPSGVAKCRVPPRFVIRQLTKPPDEAQIQTTLSQTHLFHLNHTHKQRNALPYIQCDLHYAYTTLNKAFAKAIEITQYKVAIGHIYNTSFK